MKKILLLSLRKQMHGDAFWFGFQESFISSTAMAMVFYVKEGSMPVRQKRVLTRVFLFLINEKRGERMKNNERKKHCFRF